MTYMTNRLTDAVALLILLAAAWLLLTRIGFILSPESCWTSC